MKKATITIEIDLADYGQEIKTLKALDDYFIEDKGYRSIQEMIDNGEYYAKQYNKSVKAINEGKSVWVGSLTNEGCGDNLLELYFFDNGFSDVTTDGVEIIQDSEY